MRRRRSSRCSPKQSDALAEAHAGLADRLADAGLAAWADAQGKLAELHPPRDDYLARFARGVDSVLRRRRWRADLVTWPDAPIRYVAIPEHTRDAAPLLYYLFYRSPAAFDRLPVHDYVVTPIDGVLDAERDRRLRGGQRQHHHAQPRGPPRRAGAPRPELRTPIQSRRASGRSRRSTRPAASRCSAAARWPRGGPVTRAT